VRKCIYILKAKLNCYDGSRRVCRTRSNPVMTLTGLKRFSSLAHCFTASMPATCGFGDAREEKQGGGRREGEGEEGGWRNRQIQA
jgi:hypothetical protein